MKEERKPCAGLWKTPMIHVNGDVTTCCLDEHLENKVGNINHTPLSQIWKTPMIESWRRAHLEGNFEKSGPLCGRCNWQSAGMLSEEEIHVYRQQQEQPPKQPPKQQQK